MIGATLIAAFLGFSLGFLLGELLRYGRIDKNHRDEDQS